MAESDQTDYSELQRKLTEAILSTSKRSNTFAIKS